MTGPSDRVPAGIDVDRPSAARVYDYFLGGAHNFAVDRAPAQQIAAYFDGFTLVDPGLVVIPRWRPDPQDPVDEHPERIGAYAGVGRKV